MTRNKLLKFIITNDLRKNNVIRLSLNKKERFLKTECKEENGLFTYEIKLSNINYYFQDDWKRNKNFEYFIFEVVEKWENGNIIKEQITISNIEKIEIIKQGRTKTINPIIEQVKKYPVELKEVIEELNL